MLSFKKIIFRCLFLAELAGFSFIYIAGNHGLQSLLALKRDIVQEKTEIAALQDEIAHLQSDIVAWQTNDYFKEKVAREQLQFAKAHEEIYFVS